MFKTTASSAKFFRTITAQKNEVLNEGFLQYMSLNAQFPADLVTFTDEILNGKLHFFCAVHELYDISVKLQSLSRASI